MQPRAAGGVKIRAMTQIHQQVQLLTIEAEHEGQRIDNFLKTQLKGVPKSLIYRILRKGEVRVNKKRIKPEYKLCAGDEVRVPPVRVAQAAIAGPAGAEGPEGSERLPAGAAGVTTAAAAAPPWQTAGPYPSRYDLRDDLFDPPAPEAAPDLAGFAAVMTDVRWPGAAEKALIAARVAELKQLIQESNDATAIGSDIKRFLLDVINDDSHDLEKFSDTRIKQAQLILDRAGPAAAGPRPSAVPCATS